MLQDTDNNNHNILNVSNKRTITHRAVLTKIFLDGSWFLPHQSIYQPVTPSVAITTCERFPTAGNLRSNRSSPYPQHRPKSTSASPPPHGKNKFCTTHSILSKIKIIFSVYNPPEHIQQSIYSTSAPSAYTTSWSTLQPQTPTTIVNTPLNCWTLTSSPPPPHQISAQTTPNTSPNHQMYQHGSLTNLTNITYTTNYYNQDLTYPHYQTPEYLPISEVSYSQVSDRSTPVYQQDVAVGQVGEHLDKVNFEENTQSQNDSPDTSVHRNEWSPQNHI